MIRDIRVGLRGLRRTPAFALMAALTLALGIGLSTAVFTVADAMLLRRLPMRDQDRVVTLWGEKRDGSFDNYPLGLAAAQEFERRTRALETVAFYAYEGAWPQPIRDADRISRLRRALVSGRFFEVLATQPVLGRALQESDDVFGAAPVAVISHSAWQRRFGRDRNVLGRQILTHNDGVAYTIVGVMPPGLDVPRGTDFWTSVGATASPEISRSRHVNVIGRLTPAGTLRSAQQEMTAFFERPEASDWERDLRGVVHSLPRLLLGDARPAMFVFAAACALLLLITCINVANLLLVRGLARVREFAVRAALGAGRGRITAQLLTENALLALAGGALGVAVAAAAVRSFVAFAPPGMPRLDEIQLNATVLIGALIITCIALLIFGLAPAVLTARVELNEVLRSSARQSASRGGRLAAEVLVMGQVALAVLLLSAAGVIARSLLKLERAELSFQPSNLLIGELSVQSERFGEVAEQVELIERLVQRLQALPGVHAVSPVVAIPYAGSGGWDGRLALEGQSPQEAVANPMLNMEVVDASYFATFGIPILRGRAFTDEDRAGTPAVVMISQSTARYFWPDQDPIGKRVKFGSERTLTVVGLVPDTRYRELRIARPSVYFPLRQSFFPYAPMNLAIRTSQPPLPLIPSVRRAVADTDPGVALASVEPFDTFLGRPLAQPRLNALLLIVFAGSAALLAIVGLFGVMATMVRQRTRELGVRLALGATGHDLQRMVVQHGMFIAAIGSALGLVGALLVNRLLGSLLYEVSPTDGVTLGLVTALLLVSALIASFVPARSCTRIEPVGALRQDG